MLHRVGHRERRPLLIHDRHAALLSPRSTLSRRYTNRSVQEAPGAAATHGTAPQPDVDVLVVGAGITGIYQLYRAREAGFSVQLLEAGGGVGGTWYWNRYPGARFDSESYTYGYLFSKELFDEWEWQEHFAEQPETERYLNHVVDRFDLRRHIRFDARVTSAVYDEASGTWTVTTGDGTEHPGPVPRRRDRRALGAVLPRRARARRLPRRAAPHRAAGRRRRSTSPASASRSSAPSSSGVQVVPAIADEVASLTVYQRTANWCTPLNNTPITPEEQAQLRADFEAMRETLNTSLSGFLHPANERAAFDDSEAERRAFFEKMWNSPGFTKLTSNYTDLLFNEAANAEWCEFIAEKIRSIVARSRDRGAADPEGPPLRREAAAVRHRLLRGVQRPERVARRSPGDADRAHDRDAGSRRPTACASSTSSCGRPASTSAPARSARMGIRGRDGLALDGALGRRPDDVPRRADRAASRTSSSPAARTPRPATTRGTTATRSTSSPTRSSTRATTATTRSR